MFTPPNDEQIRRECGLRLSGQRDEDGDYYWIGPNSAWDCYIDKLDELDPEGITKKLNFEEYEKSIENSY